MHCVGIGSGLFFGLDLLHLVLGLFDSVPLFVELDFLRGWFWDAEFGSGAGGRVAGLGTWLDWRSRLRHRHFFIF